MMLYILSKNLKGTDNRLFALSMRGTRGRAYYQMYMVCPIDEIDRVGHSLFKTAIHYFNDILLSQKKLKINRLEIVGDVSDLVYCQYIQGQWRIGKKDNAKWRIQCKELSDFIGAIKGVDIQFKDWNQESLKQRIVKGELEKLVGEKYQFEENTLNQIAMVL